MNRRELLKRSAALGLTAAGSLALPGAADATLDAAAESATLESAHPSGQRAHPRRFPYLRRRRRDRFLRPMGSFRKSLTSRTGSMMPSVSTLWRSLPLPSLRAVD